MIAYVSAYAGFCFGVSLAVDTAYVLGKGVSMLGEIVHNPDVVRKLERMGAQSVSSPDEIPPGKLALIRAHGVPEAVIKRLKALSIPVIDRTCPKVKRIHDIVRRASQSDERVVVVGNRAHPEVIGIVGWCENARVLETPDDARELISELSGEKQTICLVYQTTSNKNRCDAIRDMLIAGGLNVACHDTVCRDTENRQREATLFAKKVDCVIVVGGKNSSNSTRLFEIAKASCKKAAHVESAREIDIDEILPAQAIFITGGASTPHEDIVEVVKRVEKECLRRGIPFSRGED